MKQLYFFAFLCVFITNAQKIDISDVNFEQALINRGIDQGTIDGSIDVANASSVTHLNISNSNISNLQGIEAFTNLVSLDASQNNIRNADFSSNTSLQQVVLHNNLLETINVATNVNLKELNLYKNKLTHIQLNGNTALTYLAVADNYLGSLDLSSNKSLEKLFCQNNQLTSLDVSNMPALKLVNAEMNNLATLNVGNSRGVVQIVAANNYLSSLDVSTNVNLETINVLFNHIRSLDLSFNTKLTNAFLANNQLASLNIRNGNNQNLNTLRTENNPNLSCITADDTIVDNGTSSSRWSQDVDVSFSINCDAIADKGNNTNKSFNVYVDRSRILNINSTKKGVASVYNLQGIPLVTKTIEEGTQTINMNKFSNSVYVLHIASEEGKFSQKFVLH